MKVNVNFYLVNGVLILSLLHCNYAFTVEHRDVLLQTPALTMTVRHKQKRQIYREQVLPHAGGKIPDSAFETHRLALNRLQKEGIAVPDGILLEQRSPQVHQYTDRSQRPTFRVKQTSDERYTPAEGRYTANGSPPQTVDTTYALPQITQHSVVRPMDPMEPVLRSIELPNALLRGGPQKLRAKYAGQDMQPAEPEPAQDQYQRHAASPYHRNCMKKYHPSHSIPTKNVYPTYTRTSAKMWPHQMHVYASPSSASFAYVHPALTAYQPAAASLQWNHYALPPDQSSNLIFSDFHTFFRSLQQGVFPGHIAPVYY